MKKIVTLFTMLCIVFSMLGTFTVSAKYEAGQVVFISDLAELEQLRDEVNSGSTYKGIYFYLHNDIDMSEKYGEGKEIWMPIGTAEHPFDGTFDGCGHTINLSVYMDYDAVGTRGGLFGYTETNSKIENLTVSGNVTVLGWIWTKPSSGSGTNIGAVAGYSKGIIKNCCNMADVEYTGNVGHSGGIAGTTEGSIINCYNTGTVRFCGGQGNYIAYNANNAAIQNCYYLSETADIYDTNGVCGKTVEQFASGEVAYLLNGGEDNFVWNYSPAWHQNIGEDEYPVIDNTHSIVYFAYGKYYNSDTTQDGKIKAYTDCTSSAMSNTYKKVFSYDELLDTIQYSHFVDIEKKYDEGFFENKFLFVKGFDSGSSGKRYEVTSIKENEHNITADVIKIQTGYSADVTGWVLIVEADRSLSDKELIINYIPYNVRYFEGRPNPQKDFLPEDDVKLDYTIITSQEELDEQCSDIPFLVNAYSKSIFNNNDALLIVSWQECQQTRTHKISSVKYSKDSGYDITLSRCMPENELSPETMTDYCAVIIIPKNTATANVRIITEEEKTYPYEITALRFTDTSGNEIPAPEQGKSFIVEADIVKQEERSEKDYLFVAVYDESGALMSLDYVKAKFALNDECSFGFNIPAQKKAVGSVKAFVWNTFNSAEPLAEAKILAPVVF